MNALIDAIGGTPTAGLLIVAGLLIAPTTVVAAAFWYRLTNGRVTRALELAMTGQAHEARIEARKSGRALSPLLHALSGEPAPPRSRSLFLDVLLCGVAIAPSFAMIMHGLTEKPAQPDETIALTTALMVGFALVIPASAIATLTIIHLAIRSARSVRSACVKIIARNTRSLIEAGDLRNTAPPGGWM